MIFRIILIVTFVYQVSSQIAWSQNDDVLIKDNHLIDTILARTRTGIQSLDPLILKRTNISHNITSYYEVRDVVLMRLSTLHRVGDSNSTQAQGNTTVSAQIKTAALHIFGKLYVEIFRAKKNITVDFSSEMTSANVILEIERGPSGATFKNLGYIGNNYIVASASRYAPHTDDVELRDAIGNFFEYELFFAYNQYIRDLVLASLTQVLRLTGRVHV